MNLLPKTNKEFKQQDYWNTFFKKRGKKAFEWYGEYPELCANLHKYIKPKDDILVIGCGNSTLSTDLYDVGYRKITNIDISKVVIRQMQDINKIKRPELKYIQMDALNMTFDSESFSVILDKGTLDALMPENSPETIACIDKLFSEISRVLKVGGRYVCVSLLQEHILKKLLDYFPQNNWMFRVVRCLEAEQKTTENNEGASLPVFVVVATKFKQLNQMVLEMCMGGEKMIRVSEAEEIIAACQEAQTAALVCTHLTQSSIVGEPIKLDLFRPGETIPRFSIYVMDQITSGRKQKKYAVFIVPQGRESDWLFSTPEGRDKLLKSVEQDRLAVVIMHRGQFYESWDAVKAELTANIKLLKPAGSEDNIPFLSLGTDVGFRVEIYRGESKISGEYVIEEIPQQPGVDSISLRRLIFLSNPFLVQSEALVKIVKSKNTTRCIVDTTKLTCDHHTYMTVGVQLSISNFKKQDRSSKSSKEKLANYPKCLVIGLGGGGLCTFLHHYFKNLQILAIEIDSEMLNVAENYFGLKQDFRFQIKIDDGIKYILDAAQKGEKFDSILFDVDNKDPSLAIRCPPKEFLEVNFLEAVKECLTEKGIFMLNLVCRDDNVRTNVIKLLVDIFENVCSYVMELDLNMIIYCTNTKDIDWKTKILEASETVNKLIGKSGSTNDFIDMNDVFSYLNIH
ncbi:methyltransferase-like protein 13 [Ctenocephalides felis]|uniref:methyltransferase-like protein 13 n=1 Tax=Ctenocephalides felis TaxID=7515 RepID=UPI000E6E49D9|nr:methyltransferase-like protein 13 [Ctenocephalides felis]